MRIKLPKARILLAATAVLSIVTYATLRATVTSSSQPIGGPTAALEVELTTLRPAGFEPAEIIRPKGSFVLFIDDRSGKENSSLVMHRVMGERVRAISINRKKSDWHDVIDLPPGTYVLQDASDSELRCQITILP